MYNYSSDKPINDVKNDLFNRSKFVKNIIRALKELGKNDCYTIGLYAKWGSGKTSTANLIQQELNDAKDFFVIYVDAWEHDGRIMDMQYEIASQIIYKERGGKRRRSFTDVIKNITKHTPDELSIEGIAIPVGKIGGSIISAFENRKIKKALEKTIQESQRKFVIIIDNIDRLDSRSILRVLLLINQLANYGGATYFLPFDKEYVCKSIENELPDEISGEEYLEKIVNLPLNLPPIPQSSIDKIFLKALSSLFEDEKVEAKEADITRFRITYLYYGMNSYLETPRDIGRILNSLKFILPSKKNDTNVADLVLIEMIRVFDAQFYAEIYNSKSLLISDSPALARKYSTNNQDSEKKEDLKLLTRGDRQKELILAQLFPYVKTLLWNGERMDSNGLRRDKRIASEYYFDVYFSPLDDFTNVADGKIAELLKCSNAKKDIDKIIAEIVKPSNYDVFLKKISDNIDLIQNKRVFCESLLDMAGETYEQHIALTLNLSEKVLFAIDNILKNSTTKLEDYKQLLQYNYNRQRFQTIPYLIHQTVLYSTQERSRTGDPTLKEGDLDAYKEFALEIIRDMARKGVIPLSTMDGATFIYHYWSEFAGRSEVSKYIREHVKNADEAIDFISQFLGIWSESGSSNYKRRDLDVATIKQINNYIEATFLFDLISNDEKYSFLIGINDESLPSFEEPLQRDRYAHIAKLGNEHTDEFREIVARRFLYYYSSNRGRP